MDELSFEIGKNIRKYRKLKGLTLGAVLKLNIVQSIKNVV